MHGAGNCTARCGRDLVVSLREFRAFQCWSIRSSAIQCNSICFSMIQCGSVRFSTMQCNSVRMLLRVRAAMRTAPGARKVGPDDTYGWAQGVA
eukprot:gene8176-biopygen75